MDTAINNPHAQAVAALLRHTVCNPSAPTMRIDYNAWHLIKRIVSGDPKSIHKSQVQSLIEAFCKLTPSIAQEARLSITEDDLTWLITTIEAQDSLSIHLMLAMATMTPKNDLISLNESADMLGHKSTSTLRTWISEGRFFSASKPGGRDWLLARSELELRNDM